MAKKMSAEARTPENYEAMIAVAAYFKAERRGFSPGREVDDWLDAKSELDELLLGGAEARAPVRRKAPAPPRASKPAVARKKKAAAKATAAPPRKKSSGKSTAAAGSPAKKRTAAGSRAANLKPADRKA